MLHVRNVTRALTDDELSIKELEKITSPPYFVPLGTPLHTQLLNFQHQKKRIGLVVDEYGGVQGLLTLEDVLETILGLEIIDEGDKSQDMQELARRFWQQRVKAKGLKLDDEISRE